MVTEFDTPTTLAKRARLVERLRLDTRISDPRVLEAFARVPRHCFVPDSQRGFAYEDRALPLLEGQTISQPTMIAIMLEALRPQKSDRVLEVGGGSGYAAALLAELVGEVYTIEIRPRLVAMARHNLGSLGLHNVWVELGDGRNGLVEHAPFQSILVSAGAAHVPAKLLEQLAVGGRIAIPVDDGYGQTLQVGLRRPDGGVDWTPGVACMFVPLVPVI
jgi:protein-L-isoaspartate(D-aspartate) O-methyltransferase